VKLAACLRKNLDLQQWETTACGQIKLHGHDLCIDTIGELTAGTELMLTKCSCTITEQLFELSGKWEWWRVGKSGCG
jgi:hypothetical protein